MTALSESPKEDVLAECLYQHDRVVALEAKLKAVTVRHLASMLNLRRTIEQLEDELERAKFRLTDPARVERAAKVIFHDCSAYSDPWEKRSSYVHEIWKRTAEAALLAADAEE
jgi:hypothetical protein